MCRSRTSLSSGGASCCGAQTASPFPVSWLFFKFTRLCTLAWAGAGRLWPALAGWRVLRRSSSQRSGAVRVYACLTFKQSLEPPNRAPLTACAAGARKGALLFRVPWSSRAGRGCSDGGLGQTSPWRLGDRDPGVTAGVGYARGRLSTASGHGTL